MNTKSLCITLIAVASLGCASTKLASQSNPRVESHAGRSVAQADQDLAAALITQSLELLNAIDENQQTAINKVKLRSTKLSLRQATGASTPAASKIRSVKSASQSLAGFKLESATEEVIELIGEAMILLDQAIPELETQERLEAIKKEEREIESRRKAAEARRILGGLLGGALEIYIGTQADKDRQKWMNENPLQTEQGIVCESHRRNAFDSATKECGTSLYIEEISIMETYSKKDCVYGQTYGFSGRNVIVHSGCRAKFKVYGRANPPPASYRNSAADRMKNLLNHQ